MLDAADADTATDVISAPAVDELCLHVFCLCSVVLFVRACCCDACVLFVRSVAIFILSRDSESILYVRYIPKYVACTCIFLRKIEIIILSSYFLQGLQGFYRM